MASSQQPSQGTRRTVRLNIAAGSVKEVVQIQLCVGAPVPDLPTKLQQRLALQMDQVIQATRQPGELFGHVRLVYGQPRSAQRRGFIGLSVTMGVPPAAVGQLYNKLSTALTFTLGEGEGALKVGVKPAKGHIPVVLAGVPMGVTPKVVEACIKQASAATGVSVLSNTVRWATSISGGTVNDSMVAVLTCTDSTQLPEDYCFELPTGEHTATVHALPGAIPCMPMPPSMRQALQRPQQHSQQQQKPSAPAPRAATYAAATKAAATPSRAAAATAWRTNPLASSTHSPHSSSSSSNGDYSSNEGPSAPNPLETPPPAVVPSAHTSSNPSGAAGQDDAPPVQQQQQPSSRNGEHSVEDTSGGELFTTVSSKRSRQQQAQARAAADAAAAALIHAPARGRGGAGGSGLDPQQGGRAKGSRPREPKAEGATPSPDMKIAKT
jgi:hypothetical protein